MRRWWVLAALLPLGAAAAEVEGVLDWAGVARLGTPLSGVVAEVSARPGARVPAGTVLVRLEEEAAEARVRAAKAGLAAARLALDEAERRLAEVRDLDAQGLVAPQELREVEAAAERARAGLAEAEAAVRIAIAERRLTRVVAPFEALVLEVHAAPGEAVAGSCAARTLVTVARAGRRTVRWQQPQGPAPVPGTTVGVLVEGARLEARVGAVRMRADGVEVEAEIAFDRRPPPPGTKVRVLLP